MLTDCRQLVNRKPCISAWNEQQIQGQLLRMTNNNKYKTANTKMLGLTVFTSRQDVKHSINDVTAPSRDETETIVTDQDDDDDAR